MTWVAPGDKLGSKLPRHNSRSQSSPRTAPRLRRRSRQEPFGVQSPVAVAAAKTPKASRASRLPGRALRACFCRAFESASPTSPGEGLRPRLRVVYDSQLVQIASPRSGECGFAGIPSGGFGPASAKAPWRANPLEASLASQPPSPKNRASEVGGLDSSREASHCRPGSIASRSRSGMIAPFALASYAGQPWDGPTRPLRGTAAAPVFWDREAIAKRRLGLGSSR